MIRKRHYLNEGIADKVPNAKLRDLIEFCAEYCERYILAKNNCSTYDEYVQLCKDEETGWLSQKEMIACSGVAYDAVSAWADQQGFGPRDAGRAVQAVGGLDECLSLIRLYYRQERFFKVDDLLTGTSYLWLYETLLGACLKYDIY